MEGNNPGQTTYCFEWHPVSKCWAVLSIAMLDYLHKRRSDLAAWVVLKLFFIHQTLAPAPPTLHKPLRTVTLWFSWSSKSYLSSLNNLKHVSWEERRKANWTVELSFGGVLLWGVNHLLNPLGFFSPFPAVGGHSIWHLLLSSDLRACNYTPVSSTTNDLSF